MERLVTLTLVTGTLDKAREDDGRNWIGKGEARASVLPFKESSLS